MKRTKDGKHIDFHGAERWYKDGDCHREDGPAIVLPNGYRAWYVNGKCHRDGAPAVIWDNGAENWYYQGQMHRIDGPAISGPDCLDIWCINGEVVSSNEEFQQLSGISDEAMTMMILRYGDIG